MEQVQLISCIRFSMQLLISESVFMIGMKRKKNFGIYLLTGIAGYMALAYTFFRLCTSIPGMLPPVYILFYCGLFLFTLGFMKWCFEAPFQEVLFAGVCGYATEHMAFAITTIFVELTGVSFRRWWSSLSSGSSLHYHGGHHLLGSNPEKCRKRGNEKPGHPHGAAGPCHPADRHHHQCSGGPGRRGKQQTASKCIL
ncbi:MAG: hypothetical protein ACLTC4_02070 [Hungatella hathewayi]